MSVQPDPSTANRYLANQLSETERAEYEASLTESVSALAELEAVARLKVGLAKLAEESELPALQARATQASWPRLLALAAAVSVVFLGVVWWHRSGTVSVPHLMSVSASAFRDREGHALPLVATTLIFHRRAETADASIDLPDIRGVLEWRCTVPTGAGHVRYDVLLMKVQEQKGADIVDEISGLEPDDGGVVKWYVDSAGLVPGRYNLRLSEHTARGQPMRTESFLIRVRVGPNK